MDEVGDAGLGGGAGDGARAEDVQGLEILPVALIEHRDQVDHGLGALQRGGDGGRIAHIGLHRMDLADAAERLQVEGEIGAAGGDADAPAIAGERANHMAADKAGPAEHGDDASGLDQIIRHARPLVRPVLLDVP